MSFHIDFEHSGKNYSADVTETFSDGMHFYEIKLKDPSLIDQFGETIEMQYKDGFFGPVLPSHGPTLANFKMSLLVAIMNHLLSQSGY